MSSGHALPNPATQSQRLDCNTPIAKFFADPSNAHSIATNVDAKGREGLKMVMRCTSQPTVPIESTRQVAFPMKWYYCHVVELVNTRTGEIEQRVRIVLVSPEGETTSCVSQGILDSLDLIRRFEGDGPYDPPLKVRVVEQKTRGGFTVMRLELEDDESSQTAAPNRAGKNR